MFLVIVVCRGVFSLWLVAEEVESEEGQQVRESQRQGKEGLWWEKMA